VVDRYAAATEARDPAQHASPSFRQTSRPDARQFIDSIAQV
jgi:hypothetical protein